MGGIPAPLRLFRQGARSRGAMAAAGRSGPQEAQGDGGEADAAARGQRQASLHWAGQPMARPLGRRPGFRLWRKGRQHYPPSFGFLSLERLGPVVGVWMQSLVLIDDRCGCVMKHGPFASSGRCLPAYWG